MARATRSTGEQLLEMEVAERDAHELFAGTYLAPLVPMASAKYNEIRRQAICALANLSEDHLRPAVVALRNAQGRSLFADLLLFTQPPIDIIHRREAVVGLANLLRNRATHAVFLRENLVPELMQLSQCYDASSTRVVVDAIACLCANESIAHQLLQPGFVQDLIKLASGREEHLSDQAVRRNAVTAVTALSYCEEARVELKRFGGMQVALELLQSRGDAELRRQGAKLACNLCLHRANKADIAAGSPLLQQLLQSSMSPQPDEDVELALALGALALDPELHADLCSPSVTKALLALIERGGREACGHAVWAVSNLATHKPTERSLLSIEMLAALIRCAISTDGERSLATRRDALQALGWLSFSREVNPRAGVGGLLEAVVACSLSSDELLQESALVILAAWAERIPYHPQLMHGGALPALVLALQVPSPTAHLYGARALSCLSVHKHYRSMIVQAGAAEPLLRAMRSAVTHVRGNACRAVCNLSHEVDGALELLRVGAMSTALVIARGARPEEASGSAVVAAVAIKKRRRFSGDLDGGLSCIASDKSNERECEYAAKIVSNLYAAWTIEEHTSVREERRLKELRERATNPQDPAFEGFQMDSPPLPDDVVRSTVTSRVAEPDMTLLAAVFCGWRCLLAMTTRSKRERVHRRAAMCIQGRHRGRLKAREGKAASRIQASRRGQVSRRHDVKRTESAVQLQAAHRGKRARRTAQRTQANQSRAMSLNDAMLRLSGMKSDGLLRLMDVFSKLDSNSDGAVSLHEFEAAMRALDMPVSKKEIHRFFRTLDPHGSGFFAFDDFRKEFGDLRSAAESEHKAKAEKIRAEQMHPAVPPAPASVERGEADRATRRPSTPVALPSLPGSAPRPLTKRLSSAALMGGKLLSKGARTRSSEP